MIKPILHPQANDSPARRARAVTRLYGAALALFTFGALLLLAFSASGGQSSDLIVGDANAYYAWLRSPLLDGDLDFRNDFELLYPPDPLQPAVVTARGTVVNKYPPGMAAVMLMGSSEPDRLGDWSLALLIAWAATAAILISATVLYKWLGRSVLTAIERLMGMLLVAISVQMVLDGVGTYLKLTPPNI